MYVIQLTPESLNDLMISRNVSGAKLAKATGYSTRQISFIRNGKSEMSAKFKAALSKYLDVNAI